MVGLGLFWSRNPNSSASFFDAGKPNGMWPALEN